MKIDNKLTVSDPVDAIIKLTTSFLQVINHKIFMVSALTSMIVAQWMHLTLMSLLSMTIAITVFVNNSSVLQ